MLSCGRDNRKVKLLSCKNSYPSNNLPLVILGFYLMYYIYEITNIINDHKYRGMHKVNQKKDTYMGSGLAMLRALKKYGKENFKKEILEYCDTYEKLIEREKFYVDLEWVNKNDTYNMITGGYNCGLMSDDLKKKMSDLRKGKNNPAFGMIWINNGIEDRFIKEEDFINYIGYIRGQRQNINNSLRVMGHITSKETKEKLRQHNLGKKQSAETIAKRVKKNTGKKCNKIWIHNNLLRENKKIDPKDLYLYSQNDWEIKRIGIKKKF